MRTYFHQRLFRSIGWRLILLNAAVLCAILVLLSGFLYLMEVITTDTQINRLLDQTVQQERREDLVANLHSRAEVIDPPRPFHPTPLQVAFLLVDRQGRIHEGAVYRLSGLPEQRALHQVLATGVADTREVTVDGFHLRLLTVPIHDQSGVPMGALQVYVSLQERDAELAQLLVVVLAGCALGIIISPLAASFLAKRALVPIWQALEQQERFVADASHELRAPLTLLQTDVEVLQRALRQLPHLDAASSQEAEQQEAMQRTCLKSNDAEVLDEMHTELEHMRTLIADLLTLARYDAGVDGLIKSRVDLSSLLSSTIDRVKIEGMHAGVLLHLVLPENGPLAVEGDSAALHRLFLALLHNAITYTPAGGQIWLEARHTEGRRVTVLVRDTGRGIAANDLPHLFTRFYRADRARTRSAHTQEHGTGLGLSIAQAIAQRHGGSITASSPGEGQGSIFTVILKKADRVT